ncbi:hypothetical protein RRG08_020489 [Elysia crispata]|uniref:Uncharacterized protein n=1 Tax=Elysia crispata TaxID=231223 RepID=A0AAE0ZHG8_9GAST|nr:hypothetical protein RRG08_020489 [Elysia crispata]
MARIGARLVAGHLCFRLEVALLLKLHTVCLVDNQTECWVPDWSDFHVIKDDKNFPSKARLSSCYHDWGESSADAKPHLHFHLMENSCNQFLFEEIINWLSAMIYPQQNCLSMFHHSHKPPSCSNELGVANLHNYDITIDVYTGDLDEEDLSN